MVTRDHEDVVLEVKKSRIKPPPMFKVVLLNDDFTPMDFVIDVLTTVFDKSEADAILLMEHIHNKDVGLCGVYPKNIAETKVELVMVASKQEQHPLTAIMEKNEE
jgi:ATP-dependent Clp protease adaptor protein ClpS